jgi:C4-dicarboxylate-specific signal transduction histidine kinase
MKDKPVILIVDDQSQNIELFEAYLAPQGYEIITATNGKEALEKLSGNPIDLILLDVMMPGMDGFEVTRRIRQDKTHSLLPIILVTALRETEDRVKGIEAGCDDFISKPVDKAELLARVRSLLTVKTYNDLMSNYRKELEIKNKELSEAFNKIREQSFKLVQTAKMASLGVFAGGVAHELNNPLMGILNYIQFCLKHVGNNTQVTKVLKDAEYETKRCAEVIKAVMTFSRLEEEGEEPWVEESFETVISRVLLLLDYRIRENGIVIENKFPQKKMVMAMRSGAMQNAILSILSNAIDASKQSPMKEIMITGKQEDNVVVITITDKGCGIEEKYKEKVFEPFFTTKEPDKHVGLGLTMAKQIIKDHGGQISYESTSGSGSTFKIVLPMHQGR